MEKEQKTSCDYFGKYQPIFSFLSFQLPFICMYVASFHMFYSLFTLNIPAIAFYLLLMIVQSQVSRSQKYIDFMNRVFQPNRCVK